MAARGGNKGGNPLDPTPSDPITSYLSADTDATTGVMDEYNIQINFEGDLWGQYDEGDSINLVDAFKKAASFLSDVIDSDVFTDYIQPTSYNGTDIIIDASLVNIDGDGGVLGRAGPTYIWSDSLLTSQAIMEFDSADAVALYNDGLWDEVILHEMIHCLGLGTLWEYTGLVTKTIDDNDTKKPTDDTISYEYFGDLANAASKSLFPTTEGVVIETDGGSGTAGGHWDEETYDNELMTGYIDYDNYLSEITFAGLADLGYDVSTDYLA